MFVFPVGPDSNRLFGNDPIAFIVSKRFFGITTYRLSVTVGSEGVVRIAKQNSALVIFGLKPSRRLRLLQLLVGRL